MTLYLNGSTGISGVDGSSGTPAVQGTDTNTGISFPAADTVAVNTGGSERVRVDSSGRLGVGTSSPGAKVEIGSYSPTAPSLSSNSGASFSVTGTDNTQLNIGSNPSSPYNGWIQMRDTVANVARPLSLNPSGGAVLVGTSSARSWSGVTNQFQIEGAATLVGQTVIANSADANGALIAFGKSRGTTLGSNTAVQSGDSLGKLHFVGADGSALIQAAAIDCQVDGTPGANDMPGRLVFSTCPDNSASPVERLRITNGGDVFIGTTTGTVDSSNAGIRFTANGFTQISRGSGAGGGSSIVEFYGSLGQFRTMGNGNAQNTNGSFTAISDAKLKENITDANSQWDDLKAIQIRNWNFKAETGHETHRQIGPIAQELEQVCPGLVFETPDRDADGNETGEVTKGVNQSVLYMKAVKALQEAMERIEQLETEMAAVKAQLA